MWAKNFKICFLYSDTSSCPSKENQSFPMVFYKNNKEDNPSLVIELGNLKLLVAISNGFSINLIRMKEPKKKSFPAQKYLGRETQTLFIITQLHKVEQTHSSSR